MNGSEPATPRNAAPSPVPAARGDDIIANWWDGMLWHRVLRSPVLGLRPGRLGLAFFFAVLLLLLLEVGKGIDRWLGRGSATVPWNGATTPDRFELGIWQLFVAFPGALVRTWPVTMLVMMPILVVMGAVLLGAISRITAEEFSKGRAMPWHEGLAFSARLWRSTVGAYVGPLVLIWVVALLFGVLGWVLLNWPVLNIIGAILFGLFLLGALVAVIVAVAYLLGEAMLIPAVMCEGADAIDAVQRAYAYVLARPVRLILYLLLGLIGVVVVVGVLGAVAAWTIGFAAQASGMWLRPPAWNMLWWGSFGSPPATDAQQIGGVYAIGAALIQIWVLVPVLIVIASFFSTSMAAATVIYLAMRRICDGQDIGELWTPGAVEAAMAEVMTSRAEAVKAHAPAASQTMAAGDLKPAEDE